MPASLGQRGSAFYSGGILILLVLMVWASMAGELTGQEPVACEIVDGTSAETVLGHDAINQGGAATAGVCRYDSADQDFILMVQIQGAQMYDVMPINPQTPVDIGDRGRYGVGTSGSANVQYVKGEFSVTIRVSPSHRSGPSASALVEPLLEIARIAADRMPDHQDSRFAEAYSPVSRVTWLALPSRPDRSSRTCGSVELSLDASSLRAPLAVA